MIVWSLSQAVRNLIRQRKLSFLLVGLLTLLGLGFQTVLTVQYMASYTLEQLERRADFEIPLVESVDTFALETMVNRITQVEEYDVAVKRQSAETKFGLELPDRLQVRFYDLSEAAAVFEILRSDMDLWATWDFAAEKGFLDLVQRVTRFEQLVQSFTRVFLVGMGVIFFVVLWFGFRMVYHSRATAFRVAKNIGAPVKALLWPAVIEGGLIGLVSCVLALGLFVLFLRELIWLPGGEIFLFLWSWYLWLLGSFILISGVIAYERARSLFFEVGN